MPQVSIKRFEEFMATIPVPLPEDTRDGEDPYEFARKLGIHERDLQKLGLCNASGQHEELNRTMLKQRCTSANTDNEIKGAILSVFAWGGMVHGHPLRIWRSETTMPALIKIIKDTRNKGTELDPVAAFMLFIKARNENLLRYLGVSFFTKILFFFYPGSPSVEAPILDQFSAKGINALFDVPPVPLWGNMPAQPANPERACGIYAGYLACLDILRGELKKLKHQSFSRSQVEWLLFRPEAGSWREFVKNNNYSNTTLKGGKSC